MAVVPPALKKDDDVDDDCECLNGLWKKLDLTASEQDLAEGGIRGVQLRRRALMFLFLLWILQLNTHRFTALRRAPCCRKRAASIIESWILVAVRSGARPFLLVCLRVHIVILIRLLRSCYTSSTRANPSKKNEATDVFLRPLYCSSQRTLVYDAWFTS